MLTECASLPFEHEGADTSSSSHIEKEMWHKMEEQQASNVERKRDKVAAGYVLLANDSIDILAIFLTALSNDLLFAVQ